MQYEVVEERGDWVVRREGAELARFSDQNTALADVSRRLREVEPDAPARLSVRYERRRAG
jgi:hypothetical protein